MISTILSQIQMDHLLKYGTLRTVRPMNPQPVEAGSGWGFKWTPYRRGDTILVWGPIGPDGKHDPETRLHTMVRVMSVDAARLQELTVNGTPLWDDHDAWLRNDWVWILVLDLAQPTEPLEFAEQISPSEIPSETP